MDITPLELFGTDEPPLSRRRLCAGPLSVMLESGQLRDVRWHGVEVARSIAYLLRDSSWGTLPVNLSEPEIREEDGAFTVRLVGTAEGAAGRLAYELHIRGKAAGVLGVEATAMAGTDFLTNRTGFVLLHPDNMAGLPLRVGHSDGSIEATAFPQRISPDQPAFDILSMDCSPVPGVTVEVSFEGGVWEMEDQRNWSDASFKTYVRPLALPFPYLIPAGSAERQSVIIRCAGEPDDVVSGLKGVPAPTRGTVPKTYLRLAEEEPIPTRLPLPDLAQGLILRLRPTTADPAQVAAAAALAQREGLSLCAEVIFDQTDPEAEVAACLRALRGQPIEAILVAAVRDLRTRPSNSLPEGEAPLAATARALRRGGFEGRIGTGVPSFFTEFNRNPPPLADFAFFGICPIVHAADDLSVMETVSVLPAIMDSAAQLVPGIGLWPGPLAIAPTVNPYGRGLAETNGTARTCLAGRDPRHGALFGAAHLLASIVGVLPWAETLAPLHVNGPTGLSGPDGGPLPLAFVLAEVAQAAGAVLVDVPGSSGVATLAWDRDGRRSIMMANPLGEAVEVAWPSNFGETRILAPGSLGWEPFNVTGAALRLDPYRVLRLSGGAGAS